MSLTEDQILTDKGRELEEEGDKILKSALDQNILGNKVALLNSAIWRYARAEGFYEASEEIL